MNNITRFVSAALMVLTASNAQATGEARVEVRGGINWASAFGITVSEEFLGLGAGYDFDIGKNTFIGPEVSAEKFLVDGSDIQWSVGGRAGAKLGDATRLYAAAGLTFVAGDSSPYAGVGVQQSFGRSFYGRVEYRRYFDVIDSNVAGLAFGLTF